MVKTPQNSADLVLGYYFDPITKAKVITQWKNGYETLVETPWYNEGKSKYVQSYGNSIDSARAAHRNWCITLGRSTMNDAEASLNVSPYKKSKDLTFTPICKIKYKITFKALLRFLSKLSSKNNPLIVRHSNNMHDCYWFLIAYGNYSGNCYYDPIVKEVFDININWQTLIKDFQTEKLSRYYKGSIM